jgi:transcriptional regulator GlxA family with amidase domain
MTTRRTFITSAGSGLAAVAVFGGTSATGAAIAQSPYTTSVDNISTDRITRPAGRRIRVAFLLGQGSANVIDTAGPWEVFQDTIVGNSMPFQLFTVGETEGLVRMTGGLQVQPDYTIQTAPQPDLIVIPAMRASALTRDWIRQASAQTDVTMSICTGAFQLAATGLLDGLEATTHHEFWDAFEERNPAVSLSRGLRFIDHGTIATAGGLTSGIDLALHVVERYFGRETAQRTADYMEYQSDTWKVDA